MPQILPKYRKYFTHIFFWFGFFVVFVFFWSGRLEFIDALIKSFLITGIEATVAYVNLLLLVPIFFMKKKYVIYSLYATILLVFTVLLLRFTIPLPENQGFFPPQKRWKREQNNLQDSIKNQRRSRKEIAPLLRKNQRPPRRPQFLVHLARQARFIFGAMLTLGVILMSTAIGVSQIAFKKEQEATQYKSEKIQAEIKFLKSQINPHFLFNALNSAYTLAYIKADEAPEVILKISDMLRYLIYECEADKVPVEKEVTYIKNYIDIQKIRLEKPERITVDWQIENSQLLVAPMLFIPFIENSFKHSHIENAEKGSVDIQFKVDLKSIYFSIKNSIPEKEFTKDKVGGIGLDNVKRRLDLIYPDKYILDINETPSQFSVSLKLEIS